MIAHARKILHKRPDKMPFAPLTDEDRAIMLAHPARRDYIGRSLQECASAYRGERLPCPPQFETLPLPPAIVELRSAFAQWGTKPERWPRLLRAVCAVLKMYEMYE